MTALDHVGLSVADLDAQAEWYALSLGLTALPATENAALGVRARYLLDADHGWALELLERRGSQPGLQADNPSDALLTRGYGHICLRVADVDAAFTRFMATGAGTVTAPGPSPMSGLRIAFVADPEGNLIELIARPEPLTAPGGAPTAENAASSTSAAAPSGIDPRCTRS